MTIKIPHILSLSYKQEIQKFCSILPQMGLRYFVMYVIFNDGSRFVLSNIFHMLESYYYESLYKEDYSFRLETISGLKYFLCDQTSAVSNKFRSMLEERYNVHRAYYIVRECPECTFVFGAIKDKAFEDSESIYKQTINSFENFCVNFVNHFKDLIVAYNSSYTNSFVLTNDIYRKAVIKGGYSKNDELSNREKECLILASKGKKAKEIAKILKISPHTFETYSKKIKEKFQCSTMIEAIIEGIHRGVIGSINCWDSYKSPNIGSFKIVKNMNIARREIARTNLELLNSA